LNFEFDNSKVDKFLESIKTDKKSAIKSIAVFDLTGSTGLKFKYGQKIGIEKIYKAVSLMKSVCEQFHGEVIKELGDGILCIFDSPNDACSAGLAIKISAAKYDIRIKGAVTIGEIELIYKDNELDDIYGSAVDRCARISSFSLPGQILVDRALLDTVESKLKECKNIVIANGFIRNLKDIGEKELFEISLDGFDLSDNRLSFFEIYEDGRPPVDNKVQLFIEAKKELFKLGLGLRTFSKYFSGENPSRFEEPICEALKRGVKISLYVMDPNWKGTKLFFDNINEPSYIKDIKRSLEYLKEARMKFSKMNHPGEFQINTYRNFPSMSIMCSDRNEGETGRMVVTPYFYGLKRSECPVFDFSKSANPKMFEKYWKGFKTLITEMSKEYI
jgi:hypothetical protein